MTKAMDFVADPCFGGVACFMGRVRNHNLGRQVTGISYDIFEPLALNTFRAIAERARNEVGDPLKLYIAHARGRLGIHYPSGLVVAAASHCVDVVIVVATAI